jgi:hypothetical protein
MRIQLGYNPWFQPGPGRHTLCWSEQVRPDQVPLALVQMPPLRPLELIELQPIRSEFGLQGLYESATDQWFLEVQDSWHCEVAQTGYQPDDPLWLQGLSAGDLLFYTLGPEAAGQGWYHLVPTTVEGQPVAVPGTGQRWVLEWRERAQVRDAHWLQVDYPILQWGEYEPVGTVTVSPREVEVPFGLKPIVEDGQGQRLTLRQVVQDQLELVEPVSPDQVVLVSYVRQGHTVIWPGHPNDTDPDTGNRHYLADLCPLAGHVMERWVPQSSRYRLDGRNWVERTWYLLLRPSSYHDVSTNRRVAPEPNYGGGTGYHSLMVRPETMLSGPLVGDTWPTEPHTLVLARIVVQTDACLHAIRLWDVRRRGGGLDAAWLKERDLGQIPDLYSYWDLGPLDGPPYQGHGYLVIELPTTLLREAGGPFTDEEVRQRIAACLPAGVFWQVQYR